MSLTIDKEFAGRNILFDPNGKETDTEISHDIVVIGTYCALFYEELGISAGELHWSRFIPVFGRMSNVLIKNTNIESPSVFKRSAAFTLGFMEASPLKVPFTGKVSKRLADINNHQNAIVAFAYSRQCLTNASFEHPPGTRVALTNKIAVSQHSYADIIHAIACADRDFGPPQFHFLSLLYESLCYRANPTASDPLDC